MVHRMACLLVLFTLVGFPPAARGQDAADDPNRVSNADADAEKELNIGIRLTPKLLDALLSKGVERLAKDYKFDEFQTEQMRDLMHEYVPKFLHEHQRDMQRILDEWLEVAAGDEPPTPEYAAEWAERSMPVLQEFDNLVQSMTGNMREFMNDDQQVLLDGYLAMYDIGVTVTRDRLELFKEGGFNAERHWVASKTFQELEPLEAAALEEAMQQARQEAMGAASPAGGAGAPAAKPGPALAADAAKPTTLPTPKTDADEWTRWVEEYARQYEFNHEQRQKANVILAQHKAQRDKHLARNGRELRQLREMYSNVGNNAEKRRLAENKYQRLYEPVDNMFKRLKAKIATLPTRAQRKAVAESTLEPQERAKTANDEKSTPTRN